MEEDIEKIKKAMIDFSEKYNCYISKVDAEAIGRNSDNKIIKLEYRIKIIK